MAPSDPGAVLSQDRGYRLLVNSPVTMFWRQQVLAETTAWLRARGYQIIGFDAAHWSTEADSTGTSPQR